jgi:hypothetical protein
MRDKVSLIALRIAALMEEFSEEEISKAVRLLEERNSPSSLLMYLAGNKKTSGTKSKAARKNSKPIEEQRSKAVLDLETKDPQKFHVLSEFDSLLRRSLVLPEIDDIRRLGGRVSKDFSAKGSRREFISRLMAVLANKNIDEIRDVVSTALSSAKEGEKDSDYQRLAQFIITGKTRQSDTDQVIRM